MSVRGQTQDHARPTEGSKRTSRASHDDAAHARQRSRASRRSRRPGVTATARGMLAQRSTSTTIDSSVTVCVKHTPHASRRAKLGRLLQSVRAHHAGVAILLASEGEPSTKPTGAVTIDVESCRAASW